MIHKHFLLALVLLIIGGMLISGCAVRAISPDSDKISLKPLKVDNYPDFCDDLAYQGLEKALEQSLVYYERPNTPEYFSFGQQQMQTAAIRQALIAFQTWLNQKPSCQELRAYVQEKFLVFETFEQAAGQPVLFTGYYEPLLAGSQTPDDTYAWPIYGRPCDLITLQLKAFRPAAAAETLSGRLEDQTLVPYHSRQAIEDGALPACTPILAWVADPVALFFLHIQGSGRISLTDGQTVRVGYAATNGHLYRSIGRLLIDEGHIASADMSMQQIIAYLRANPEDQGRVLAYNPSYVFFRLTEGGPFGNINVQLTAGRSLAVDYRLFPAGALMYIETQKPLLDGSGTIQAWQPLQRFVLNQDTGGAIRGPRRADLYMGNGTWAEVAAGHLQHSGRMFFLMPRMMSHER